MGVTVRAASVLTGQVYRQEVDEVTKTRPPVVFNVPQGSTGATLQITVVDEETGGALDLSSGSGVLFSASRLDANGDPVAVETDAAASFNTDGSDGVVDFTLTSAVVGTPGTVYAELEVSGFSGGQLITQKFEIRVIQRARVSA